MDGPEYCIDFQEDLFMGALSSAVLRLESWPRAFDAILPGLELRLAL